MVPTQEPSSCSASLSWDEESACQRLQEETPGGKAKPEGLDRSYQTWGLPPHSRQLAVPGESAGVNDVHQRAQGDS